MINPSPTISTYIADHPIDDASTEKLLARAAAEVLAGSNRHPTDEERVQFEAWTERTRTPLFDLAEDPLDRDDVEDLDEPTRNTIFAVCQLLARAEGAPDRHQARSLDRLQQTLDIEAVDAELLENAAARHATEAAITEPVQPPEPEPETVLDRRHEDFREARRDLLRARHTPHRHTGVHGPRQVGVFGSSATPDIERG